MWSKSAEKKNQTQLISNCREQSETPWPLLTANLKKQNKISHWVSGSDRRRCSLKVCWMNSGLLKGSTSPILQTWGRCTSAHRALTTYSASADPEQICYAGVLVCLCLWDREKLLFFTAYVKKWSYSCVHLEGRTGLLDITSMSG